MLRWTLLGEDHSDEDLQGRDFSGQDLRGWNFARANLTGASFSGADIRGTTFKGANLTGTDFSGVISGEIFWWISSDFWYLSVIPFLLLMLIVSISIPFEEIYYNISDFINYNNPNDFVLRFLLVCVFSAMLYSIFIFIIANFVLYLMCVVFFEKFRDRTSYLGIKDSLMDTSIDFADGLVFNTNFSHAILKKTIFEKSNLYAASFIKSMISYSSFNDSSINNAKFIKSNIFSSSFDNSKLDRVCFSDSVIIWTSFYKSKFIFQENQNNKNMSPYTETERFLFQNTVFINKCVRDLASELNGENKCFCKYSLMGLFIPNSNLTNANLSETDLSQANLSNANLQNANLTKAHAIGTNFRGANLTGACIKNWNIDSSTNLDNVLCDYIYLEENQQKRQPITGTFEPGEFSKRFKKILSQLELVFNDGIDWQAFMVSFNSVKVVSENAELNVLAIENKGDGIFVVKVAVEGTSDVETLEKTFKQQYAQQRRQLDNRYKQKFLVQQTEIESYRRENTNLFNIIASQNKIPPTKRQDIGNSREFALDALKSMSPGEFQEAVFRYDLPRAHMPTGVSQTEQSIELICHAESKGDLDGLVMVITQVSGEGRFFSS